MAIDTSNITFIDYLWTKKNDDGTLTGIRLSKSNLPTDTVYRGDIPAVNNGTLTIQKNGTTVQTFTANQSSNVTANITVPTKTSDIKNDSGFLTAHQSIKVLNTNNNSKLNVASETISGNGSISLNGISKTAQEEYLQWGGPAKSGSVSPIGMTLSNEHSANRMAFINGDLITAEYSSDGGTTWTEYSANAAAKSQFFTKSYTFAVGRPNESTEVTADKSKTRITITAQNGNNPPGRVYTDPRKMLVLVSSATTLELLIEYRTGTNYKNNGSWTTFGTYDVSGWSGWSDIPLVLNTLGGGNTQTGNNWQLRLTFTVKTKSSSYPKTASILAARIYGQNTWTTPSTMAETGHMYTFDMSKNVTFPAGVSATSFTEGGTSLANKYLGKTAKAADADKLDGNDSTYYLNYNNLNNKPTIPAAANNGTITIKQTGVSDQAFTVNQSNNTTITLVDTWRPLGTGASDACAGNDARLSNARTPTAHTHTSNDVTDALTLIQGNNITLTPTASGLEISAAADGKVKTVNNQQPDSNGNVTVPIPTELKNPNALTFGSKSYDGSSAQKITLDDLGGNIINCYDTSTDDTAGTWTVSIPNVTELIEGLTIKIRLKTSYNSSKNTLNVNGLGAKTIYFKYGNKLTSHYAKESVLALTYTSDAISSGNDRSGWIIENIYDSTNTYQLRKYYTRYKTKSALYRYMICFINKDDELIPVNNVSNSTDTTKTLTTESFMLSKGIYYYNSTTTVAAAKYTGNATLYQQLGLINLQYSFNTGTTLTANKPVYLVVTPQADGQVKLASTPIAQSLPTSDTNDWYVFLGTAYDNYRIELPIEHPIYAYHNGYCESLDHTHYNKTILDNTTASFTTTDKTNLGNVLNVAAANTNKITTLEGNVVKLTGDQTINGVKTFNAPTNANDTEQTTMKIKTANGGAIIFGKEGPNSGSMIRLDQTDGTTRLQFRASSTPGAMVWKQPESGAALYFDFGPNAARTTMPTSGGTLAYTSQIPTTLKNPHALTFGKKTYDGSSAQSITASDLGALTSHQSLADYVKKSDLASVAQTVSSNTSKITTLQGYFNADGHALLAVSASNDADGNEITTTYANQVDLDNTNTIVSALKTKLDGIEAGANKTTIDASLSSTSTNPVQNKVIYTALDKKVDKVSGKGLSTNDLTNALKTEYDDANSKKHTHANKDILDATEESFTTDLKDTYDGYNGLIQGLNNRVAIYSTYTSDITESMSFDRTQLERLQSLFTVAPNAQIIRFYYGNTFLRSFIDFNVSIHVTSSDTTITFESPKEYKVLLSGKRNTGGKIENILMCFSYSHNIEVIGYSNMTFDAIGIEEEGTY